MLLIQQEEIISHVVVYLDDLKIYDFRKEKNRSESPLFSHVGGLQTSYSFVTIKSLALTPCFWLQSAHDD
jgi:hypothetical protein